MPSLPLFSIYVLEVLFTRPSDVIVIPSRPEFVTFKELGIPDTEF